MFIQLTSAVPELHFVYTSPTENTMHLTSVTHVLSVVSLCITLKAEIRKAKFLAVGEACMAIFWPAPDFKERSFDSSVFSACVHSTPLQGTAAAVLPQLQIKTNTKVGYKEMGNIVDIYNLYLILGGGGGGGMLLVHFPPCIKSHA